MIGAAGLTKLSEMICGDDPFNFFPYRSSSNLTRFFRDLDLEYVHDGSTRRHWVNDTLKDINQRKPISDDLPPKEMVMIIEYLLHPDHFLSNEKYDREKAIESVEKCLKNHGLSIVESHSGLMRVCKSHGEFISTSHQEIPTEKLITFKPSVFQIPNKPLNPLLVSVMMPFNSSFTGTYTAIKNVTNYMKVECYRADDLWDNSTFIQDIFDLIYCSKVVIVDYTGRNPNVMYETGIAHTLGKIVVPITQSINDIPSDLGHHRALVYLSNEKGLRDLSGELYKRLKQVINT
ncbi:hypothetical protein [Serratia marcescens]|uniref:hypothetical protein n=1 Tax=Serratia marcescens TaxID=615 RepID=UPI00293241BC|nr:hypothetical protein [Serratia marcescens]MDV2098195.1 hypothetical protein [Serratia marcescens]